MKVMIFSLCFHRDDEDSKGDDDMREKLIDFDEYEN